MRLGAFELKRSLPRLKEPHALVRLEPWVDVGSVGTLVLNWLEANLGARELGKLYRPGSFIDFTRYRPIIYNGPSGRREMTIPNTYATYGKRKKGNDFIFLHMLEPNNHSELFVESVLELLLKFGIRRYCLIGSMYDYVPHTRPLLVTGSASSKATQMRLRAMGIESSSYEGPTTIVSLVPQRALDLGIETMSLIVHLPQYTQMEEDYVGAARLMAVLSQLYDLPIDETYVTRAEGQLSQIGAALEKNPQLKTIVQQLESSYEERTPEKKEREVKQKLSPEIESFLKEMEKRFRES